jgi:hypothetical protein
MNMREDGEVNKLCSGHPGRPHANGPISSLSEAWFHVLDKCVINLPLSEVILPLMRDCFFVGATYAVLSSFNLRRGTERGTRTTFSKHRSASCHGQ